MERRIRATVVLGILVASFLLSMPGSGTFAIRTSAQSSTLNDSLWLGYSPSTLFPPSSGVPIYTQNDQLWVLSKSTQTITVILLSPNGTRIEDYTLVPASAKMLYYFSPHDQEGSWLLEVFFPNSSNYRLSILFSNPTSHPVALTLKDYSLLKDSLNLDFSSSAPTQIYDVEACPVPHARNNGLLFALPSDLGIGTLSIEIENGSSLLSVNGLVNNQFSTWFELTQSYGFNTGSANEFVSKDVSVATSVATVFNNTLSSSIQNHSVALSIDGNLRPGKYAVRAFFESANNFEVMETPVLLNGNEELSLSNCNPFQLSSSSFSVQASLNGSPESWPDGYYLLYHMQGVAGMSYLPLQLGLSRIDISSQMIGGTLPQLNYSISSNPPVQLSSEFNNSIFIVANKFPTSVSVVPRFGAQSLDPISLDANNPYLAYNATIPIGAVHVLVLIDGSPLVSAKLSITNGFGGRASAVTGRGGDYTFYLPPGNYTITATRNSTQSKQVSVHANVVSNAEFQFSTVIQTGNILVEALAAILVVGVLANIGLWLIKERY